MQLAFRQCVSDEATMAKMA